MQAGVIVMNGTRYIRAYRTKGGLRYALWDRVGGRNKRVGTATTEDQYRRFLEGGACERTKQIGQIELFSMKSIG